MACRVALIGRGFMARVHAEQLRTMPDVEIAGVLARSRDSAATLARELGCAAYDDFDAMVREARPDAVDITAPTPLHRQMVERCASAGTAIFVEKPLARTMADCDAIVAAVKHSGVPCMVGHVCRYFPEYRAAKNQIDSGAIGKPVALRLARLTSLPQASDPTHWYHDRRASGGVALDLMVHDYDWLLWTLGPAVRITARAASKRPDAAGLLDYVLATIRFASGAIAHVAGSWAHVAGFRTSIEAAGDAGLLTWDSAHTTAFKLLLHADGTAGGRVALPEQPSAPGQDPYYLELRAFLDALAAGEPPPVRVEEAYAAARIGIAALESIDTGRTVAV